MPAQVLDSDLNNRNLAVPAEPAMRYAITFFNFFIIYIAALCLGGLSMALGQTIVPANINSNITWTKANSPYLVKSSCSIATDVVVTIEAGVEVQFYSQLGITVRGRVETLGERNDSVKFVNIFTDPKLKDFKCFHLRDKGNLSFRYTTQKGAYNQNSGLFCFVYAETNAGNITLANCRLSSNQYIFFGKGGENKIIATESIFELSLYAISNFGVKATKCHFDSLQNSALYRVVNGEIDSCTFTNIDKYAIVANAAMNIKNSRFEFNRTAIATQSINEKFLISGCSFTNNDVALEFDGVASALDSIFNNRFCANVTYNIQSRISNKYKLNLTNNCWCKDDTTAILSTINDPSQVEVFPVHISCRPCMAYIYKDTSSVCADSSIKILGKQEPDMLVNWTSEENISPSNLSTLVIKPFNNSETIISKKYIYEISNPKTGCTSKDSVSIKVLPKQHPKCRNCMAMALKSNLETCSEKPIDIGWDQENKFWQYQWSPKEDLNNDKIFSPEALIKNPTNEILLKKYKVQITDIAAGCTHADSMVITILPKFSIGCEKRPMPHPFNIMTPNGDKNNATFFIDNLLYYSNIQIAIYNKWGMEIYTNKHYQNDWSAPNQPDGTYFYHIIVPELNQELRGDFIITSSQ